MRTAPKITVLMPVYNAEKFVGEAIESVLNQTFKDFELLIINDASTDSSEKIILSYRDPRIRYCKNISNLRVAKTLNRGLKMARGKYIARQDADDIFLPQKLELQDNALKKDKDLIMVCSHFDYMDEKGNFLSSFREALSPEEIYYNLQFRNCIGHPTAIFNKRVIMEEFKGYSEEYEAEDHDLWLRISKKYKILKLDKTLVKVRLSQCSKTALLGKTMVESNATITRNNLQSLIGEFIDFDIISVLADLNSFNIKPSKIKEALMIKERIDAEILESSPPFLDKTIISKCITDKKNELKFNLLIATLFYSKFGSVFKVMFKIYLSVKYQLIKCHMSR